MELHSNVVALGETPAARANQLQAEFQTAERALDAALTEAMTVMQGIIGTGAHLGLATQVTQKPVAATTETIRLLTEARAQMVVAHRGCSRIGDAIGVRPTASGFDKTENASDAELAPKAEVRRA